MTITKKTEGQKLIVAVEGWLDVASTAELEAYLTELGEVKELLLDFEKLEYISSAGVRTVITAYKRQKECGGSIAVIKVSDEVMDVFSMTGINRKIDITQ